MFLTDEKNIVQELDVIPVHRKNTPKSACEAHEY